jgi:hypothetical protein
MVQAAAAGAIDFAKADFRSRRWWLKLRWMADQIETQNAVKLFRMQHAQHMGVLDYTLEKQAFDGHWNASNNLLQDTHDLLFPWARGSGENRRKSEIETLMDKWKAKYGDPSDPAVQAHFKRIADALRKRTATASENMFSEQKKLRKMVNHVTKSRRGVETGKRKK